MSHDSPSASGLLTKPPKHLDYSLVGENARKAVELGLADGLGSVDYVAREIVKAEDVIDYTRHENVAERLAKRFGAAMGAGAVHALQSLPAVR